MHRELIIACLLFIGGIGTSSCQQASKSANKTTRPGQRVGGPCETCELINVGIPRHVDAVDTSAGWYEEGQKLLVQGTVYQRDGKTPAPGIIVYYWQTDNKGLYSPSAKGTGNDRRHGHLRGWMKTGDDGKFSLYTIRPASYPNTSNPQHIHVLVKEPDIENEYYIDEWLFDDDPLFKKENEARAENRGGNGTLQVVNKNGLQVASKDIILGLNIPGYPKK